MTQINMETYVNMPHGPWCCGNSHTGHKTLKTLPRKGWLHKQGSRAWRSLQKDLFSALPSQVSK